MASDLVDVKHQLVFYGQYHAHPYNIAVHIIFVPSILWASLIMLAAFPKPAFFPSDTYDVFPPYLSFVWSWAVPLAAIYEAYYIILEPIAAVLYMPMMSLMVLSSGPLATSEWGVKFAVWLFSIGWVAQFLSHGFVEKRAPALLDNIAAAFILAPFFVHLEILFALGYRPQLHKQIQNAVGVKITEYRQEKARAERGKKEL